MEVEKIDRINALAHKAKSVGLTEEEKKERELLRKEYIASRTSFSVEILHFFPSRKTTVLLSVRIASLSIVFFALIS